MNLNLRALSKQRGNIGYPEDVYGWPVEPHTHIDRQGIIHKCYHSCKNLLTDIKFWIGLTMGFPVEHLIWDRVWPFKLVTAWIESVSFENTWFVKTLAVWLGL